MAGDEPTLEEMARVVRKTHGPMPSRAVVRFLGELDDADWYLVRALVMIERMEMSFARAENALASHNVCYAGKNEAGTRG